MDAHADQTRRADTVPGMDVMTAADSANQARAQLLESLGAPRRGRIFASPEGTVVPMSLEESERAAAQLTDAIAGEAER